MAQGLFNLKQVTQAIQQNGWATGTKPTAVDFLIVAGGGGAGASSPGGGGAGGLLVGSTAVVSGSAITVTVGAGGGGTSGTTAPSSGSNSVFGSQIAIGGGKGGNNSLAGGDGGSGGGAGSTLPGGQGTVNQGFAGGTTQVSGGGGATSGGGGAGGIGQSPTKYNVGGQGGNGLGSVITGTMTGYGGGGDGTTGTTGSGESNPPATFGGGGNSPGTNGGSGTANTGGGGGGGANYTGGSGGSGVVVISYPDVYAAATSTTGSPTVSTSGSGSIAYTGSTSVYLSTATNTSSFAFGTGDFTIEFWLYLNSSGSYTLYDSRALSTNDLSPTIYLSSNVLTFFTNGGDRITSGTVLSNTTWYHIAAVRISGVTKLYINGTQTGSSYNDTNNYINTSGRPFVGSGSVVVGQNALNGYLTNVRVVKGVGVYTGNFTSPTAPLQATQPAGTNIAAITGTSTSLLLNSVSGGYLADASTLANTFSVSTAPVWNALSPFTVTGYKNRVYRWTSSGSITF